jgi:hypothetical protein
MTTATYNTNTMMSIIYRGPFSINSTAPSAYSKTIMNVPALNAMGRFATKDNSAPKERATGNEDLKKR